MTVTPGLRTYEDAQAAYLDARRAFRYASIRELQLQLLAEGAQELYLQWVNDDEARYLSPVAIVKNGHAIEDLDDTYSYIEQVARDMDFDHWEDVQIYLPRHRTLPYFVVTVS